MAATSTSVVLRVLVRLHFTVFRAGVIRFWPIIRRPSGSDNASHRSDAAARSHEEMEDETGKQGGLYHGRHIGHWSRDRKALPRRRGKRRDRGLGQESSGGGRCSSRR